MSHFNDSDTIADGLTTSKMICQDKINTTHRMISNETAFTYDTPSINIEPIISDEVFVVFNVVTNYLLFPLCIVGVVFCLFPVVVYMTKNMRCASSIYLVALNITELANACITLSSETLRLIYGESYSHSQLTVSFSVYVFTYLGVSMRRSSYCISCVLSIERFIAIAFPLQSKQFKAVRYPVTTVIATFVVVLTFHLVVIFKLEVYPYQTDNKETKWGIGITDLYYSDKYNHDIWSQASKAIFVYTVLTVCMVCNLLLVATLRRQSGVRRDIMGSQGTATTINKRERRTTLIVIMSTCTLVLLALPSNITSTIIPLPTARENNLFHTMLRVGTICELISNCCGFVFYITLSSLFRKNFVRIFCSPCKKKNMSATPSLDLISKSSFGSIASDLTASDTL